MLCQGTLKRNITRDYLLAEARSELEMQQLRVVDRALQESGLQHHSQRMEPYTRRISGLIIPREREKNWLSTELDRRENVLHEDRMRGLQEWKN